MGRPTKQNLDYFSIDQSFFSDKKFARVTLKHGMKARMIFLYVLSLIYFDKGYYVEFSEDTCAQIAVELGTGEPSINMDVIEDIIKDEVNAGLFDKKLFDESRVLTSAGIQKHYFFVSKDRKCNFVNFDYWILSEEQMEKIAPNSAIFKEFKAQKNVNPSKSEINGSKSEINPSKSQINPSKSEINPESKVKESKVKERKGKESKGDKKPDGFCSPDGEPAEAIDTKMIIERWNNRTRGMPKICSISNLRKKHLNARVDEVGKDEFMRVMDKALDSDFLNGMSKKGWKASFDWMINPNNFTKIQEGNYDNAGTQKKEKSLAEMMQDGTLEFDENGDLVNGGELFGRTKNNAVEVDFEVIESDFTGIAGADEPFPTHICEF